MHSRNPGYQKNNHWCVCDICGFDYRRSDMMTTWDGKNVCAKDFETRHPQELLKVPVDNMSPVGIQTGDEGTPTYVELPAATTSTDNITPTSTFNLSVL